MKAKKNILLLTSCFTALGLFVIGFFGLGALMLSLTQSALSHKAFFLTPSEPFQFKFLMGLLLAFCLPIATLMAWLKTKSKDAIRPLSVAGYSIIPLLSAGIGMWLRVMEIKLCVLESTASRAIVADFKVPFTSINLFEWGIISMLVVCIPAMYMVSRRQNRSETVDTHGER